MTLIQFETVTPPPATLGMLPMRNMPFFRRATVRPAIMRPTVDPIDPIDKRWEGWDPKGPLVIAKNAGILRDIEGWTPRPMPLAPEGWTPRPQPMGPTDAGATLPTPTPIQPPTCPPPPPCVCSFQSTPTLAPIGAPTPAPAPIPPPAPLYSATTSSMFAAPSGSAPSMYANAGPGTNSMFAKVQGGGSQAASVSGSNALSGLPGETSGGQVLAVVALAAAAWFGWKWWQKQSRGHR